MHVILSLFPKRIVRYFPPLIKYFEIYKQKSCYSGMKELMLETKGAHGSQ